MENKYYSAHSERTLTNKLIQNGYIKITPNTNLRDTKIKPHIALSVSINKYSYVNKLNITKHVQKRNSYTDHVTIAWLLSTNSTFPSGFHPRHEEKRIQNYFFVTKSFM